ncbi:MAG: isoprenylcysteine carboxylmethyltransferase family protein [Anaerolineales bacterium]|nr:isoprenylcysteine carboxylmethyltransferase family protein [Anaerolineales bacterium]
MNTDSIFRLILILSVVFIGVIRAYFQTKISRDSSKFTFRENAVSLAFGGTAAIINLVFGAEYIFFPGAFAFAYALPFPMIVRWGGVVLLAAGIVVLGTAHYHLGLSFSSFVGSKERHALVQSGPYRLIRHPIYLAYLLLYLGGGLTAGNWVLAFVPFIGFSVMAWMRMPKEEQILMDLFGGEYTAYRQRTGRLLPRMRPGV